jgi:hypothetical protein
VIAEESDGTAAVEVGEYAIAPRRQAAARDAYERSVAEGAPLTAAALAAAFGRSVRWAQERISEVRKERNGANDGRSDRSGRNDMRSAGGALEDGNDRVVSGTGQASRAAQRFDAFIVAVVALVAAAASYEHQRSLAVLAGEGALAWVLPISVDGMMLATSRSILRRRRSGIPVPFLSWFGFALGFVASVAANVAAADPTLVGRLLAAWPPMALFIAYETLAADHGEFRQP